MIHVDRPLGPVLWYHVLSHLDLGHDAANLYTPERPRRPWVPHALAILQADPSLQFTPLFSSEVEHLQQTALGPTLAAELGAVTTAWQADDAVDRHRRFFAEVAPDLGVARKALRAGPLVIYDVPALGPHARAVTRPDGRRIVATDLSQPSAHVFCQILHEEIHPHSDPLIMRFMDPVPRAKRATRGASDGERSPEGRSEPRTLRDTRPGTPGWNLHKALEVAAVEGGRQIVEGHVKHRKADYAAWCRRVGA